MAKLDSVLSPWVNIFAENPKLAESVTNWLNNEGIIDQLTDHHLMEDGLWWSGCWSVHVRGHLLQAGHDNGDDDAAADDDGIDDDDDLGAATSWHMWDTKAVFFASAKQN